MPELPQIWSDAFLDDEIRELDAYKEIGDEAVEAFAATARELLAGLQGVRADEQLTIERVITPLLEALGWPTPLPKRNLTSRDEVDLVLYPDVGQRELSLGVPERDQVLRATGIVECKAWNSPFDTFGSGSRPGETAAQQLQRYLLAAGTDSNEALRWGILTNGAQWRIYSYRARPRDRTWKIDLADLLVSQDLFNQVLTDQTRHQLRIAWLLLRRDSWLPAPGERESLLDRLLARGRHADEQIVADLSKAIFQNVYPDLISALWAQQQDAAAEDVAHAALTFLYRLLFIFYAEDRGMLDTEDARYHDYSLRHGVRYPAAQQVAAGDPSRGFTRFWDHIAALSQVLDHGDPQLGLPPYDGGLFSTEPGSLLAQAKLTDAQLAPIIAALSHTEAREYISYRTLEIQQLGSIYERLLERVPQRDADGHVEVVVSPYARKDSGSYYTPQELVDLIVEQTLRPLRDECVAAFEAEPTEANDPAAALLRLKVLDPAMGSGHFLITAIDWLTAEIEDLLDHGDSDGEPTYVSPVQAELERIETWRNQPLPPSIQGPARDEIEQRRAVERQFPAPDRRALIRRMVLKRCIYGVDKNPMAVELAKVALWVHTFTPPLPLPYLNHRIRAGDSLLGVPIQTAHDYLAQWSPDHVARGLFSDQAALLRNTAAETDALNDNLDLTILAIGESARDDSHVNQNRTRLRKVLNLIAGLRWLSIDMKKADLKDFHAPLTEATTGHPARADAILHNGENDPGLTPATPEFHQIRDQANEIAGRENIFHWEIEFPHVMDVGGFDAVITNPPWDRVALQAAEWWASRHPSVASAGTAAERDRVIAELRRRGDPVIGDYDDAVAHLSRMSLVFRESGDYPMLSTGSINLYRLFVERALNLLNDHGVAGLLTPSGIYGDEPTAKFFQSMSTTGRIRGLYDFENRRLRASGSKPSRWFPDVHPQFKFCAVILGGALRRFPATHCGFYLDGKADLGHSDRVFTLTPDDFDHINPNTGTAPILRSRRDADIVRHLYTNHPVLVRRSSSSEDRAFRVQLSRMLSMGSNADLFRTAAQLDQDGWYLVAGGRYRRGTDECLPLYQGRMLHYFDHRAAGVDTNPENRTKAFVTVPTTQAQHANPNYLPTPLYWVPLEQARAALVSPSGWYIGFRKIARTSDERTMIGTVLPDVAFGDSIQLLLPDDDLPAHEGAALVANLSAIALDFVAKCKMHGANLNFFVAEQLPVIAPTGYDRKFGDTAARELVRDHVLRLTYTAHDLAPFARDLGYEGDPYIWDPEERRQLRARLDALYFHLYGLDEGDTAYVLDQFPVLEKNERKAYGRYLTKELVLGHYRALAAGDTASEIRLD